MRKLFSLYKKRVGKKIKTEKLEGTVSADSLDDEKTGGLEDCSSVEEVVGGAQNTPVRSDHESTEPQGRVKIQGGGVGFAEERQPIDMSSGADNKESGASLGSRSDLGNGDSDNPTDEDDFAEEWRDSRRDASVVEEDETQEPSRRHTQQRKRSFANSAEVIDYIPERVHSLPPRLHENLLGVIAVEVTENNPSNVKYRRYVDWRGEKVAVSELYEGVPDTTVTVSEYVFMEIARGNLNPQIALVSNRVRVAGKVGFGIYFFNLISPR